ncbi:hypothetical protein ACN09C_00430 [Serratia fonticola]|uniref:hypothetical protein n=1 Tax=Serratia fonticola TaxID=47917 RepID=UPI003AFFDE7B
MLHGLTKKDHDTIGFVVDALFSNAIDKSETREWATRIIRDNDVPDIPGYIFDLINFDEAGAHIYKLIGFFCDWQGSDSQSKALYGIALKRGKDLGEECTPKAALKALETHPEVEQRFRETFPFIDF